MNLQTKHFLSLFHTPSQAARQVFYCVVRAGWVQTAPEYRIQRSSCSGHDVLFCLSGAGFVRCSGRTHPVEAGNVAWINGYHPHAHWANPERPWQLYWIRMDAPWLEATWQLLGADRRPVVEEVNRRKVIQVYKQVFALLADRPFAQEALMHAEIARLVAHLFETRQAEMLDENQHSPPTVPVELLEAYQQMNLYPHRPWQLAELARVACVSVPHFCRQFRRAFHASPIDWLRRERITRAKRRLLESSDSIKQIATQVGYRDPFFFSRDFKRYADMSPTEFRRQGLS